MIFELVKFITTFLEIFFLNIFLFSFISLQVLIFLFYWMVLNQRSFVEYAYYLIDNKLNLNIKIEDKFSKAINKFLKIHHFDFVLF